MSPVSRRWELALLVFDSDHFRADRGHLVYAACVKCRAYRSDQPARCDARDPAELPITGTVHLRIRSFAGRASDLELSSDRSSAVLQF